jgi:hypothetical protein
MPDSDLFDGAESLRESDRVNVIRRLGRRALATASKLRDALYLCRQASDQFTQEALDFLGIV